MLATSWTPTLLPWISTCPGAVEVGSRCSRTPHRPYPVTTETLSGNGFDALSCLLDRSCWWLDPGLVVTGVVGDVGPGTVITGIVGSVVPVAEPAVDEPPADGLEARRRPDECHWPKPPAWRRGFERCWPAKTDLRRPAAREFLQAGIALFCRRLAPLFQPDDSVLVADLELGLGIGRGCPLGLHVDINARMGRRHFSRRRQARLNGRRHDPLVEIFQLNLANYQTPSIYASGCSSLDVPSCIRDVGQLHIDTSLAVIDALARPIPRWSHSLLLARFHAKPIE